MLTISGRFNKAIELFHELLEFDQNQEVVYYHIAETYEKAEDFESALTYYLKSISYDQEFADSWSGVAVCYLELGKLNQAKDAMLKAITLSQDNADFYLVMADIEWKLGSLVHSELNYRKAMELNPENSDIWLDMSDIYAEAEDFETALQVIDEAINLFPANDMLVYRKAAYYFLEGDRKLGFHFLQMAMILNPLSTLEFLEYDDRIADDLEINQLILDFLHTND